MKSSGVQLAILAAAVALVAAATAVQGRWTERWAPISRDEVIAAARLLEERFPTKFGEWEAERDLESDPKELAAAGAVGHISRLYRNTRSKARVSAFVVCALPFDASAHTPDRCYPGAGFTIGESEHRVKVPIGAGRLAEVLTGTFAKAGRTLRIFWT
ncbi:MAG: exosortase-associated EpsI family protein [Planctomycetota bacterium]